MIHVIEWEGSPGEIEPLGLNGTILYAGLHLNQYFTTCPPRKLKYFLLLFLINSIIKFTPCVHIFPHFRRPFDFLYGTELSKEDIYQCIPLRDLVEAMDGVRGYEYLLRSLVESMAVCVTTVVCLKCSTDNYFTILICILCITTVSLVVYRHYNTPVIPQSDIPDDTALDIAADTCNFSFQPFQVFVKNGAKNGRKGEVSKSRRSNSMFNNFNPLMPIRKMSRTFSMRKTSF